MFDLSPTTLFNISFARIVPPSQMIDPLTIVPVILVPGGTKVDVVFTKSVEVGASDVAEAIKDERSGK